MHHFAPVEIALGCHWHHFGFPILAPFVEMSPNGVDHSHQNLVYLPFEYADRIAAFLAPFDQYYFFVYHKNQPLKGWLIIFIGMVLIVKVSNSIWCTVVGLLVMQTLS
jgi:hypothetical protein